MVRLSVYSRRLLTSWCDIISVWSQRIMLDNQLFFSLVVILRPLYDFKRKIFPAIFLDRSMYWAIIGITCGARTMRAKPTLRIYALPDIALTIDVVGYFVDCFFQCFIRDNLLPTRLAYLGAYPDLAFLVSRLYSDPTDWWERGNRAISLTQRFNIRHEAAAVGKAGDVGTYKEVGVRPAHVVFAAPTGKIFIDEFAVSIK